VGASGSGKTTLLRCVNALEDYHKGSIYLGDELIGYRELNGRRIRLPESRLARQRAEMGMVFQSYNLFPHLSVERNVTLALTLVRKMAREEARAVASAMVAKVGLADKLRAFPDELSGGQQQRVAIARSLAMQPALMLFDEITSALDPELVGEVLKVLESVAEEGMTMMLVTHEMNFAKNVADRVIFMHEGRIHEDGPARETLLEPRTAELRSFLNAVLH
jgi:polar amino acid transport system ATP-binding protein